MKKTRVHGPIGRHYAYALCKDDREYGIVHGAAAAEGLSVSNFVRRCINSYLLELGDDVELLAEVEPRPRQPKPPAVRGPGRPRKDARSTGHPPPSGGLTESHGGD